jgi:hypothetical protein
MGMRIENPVGDDPLYNPAKDSPHFQDPLSGFHLGWKKDNLIQIKVRLSRK